MAPEKSGTSAKPTSVFAACRSVTTSNVRASPSYSLNGYCPFCIVAGFDEFGLPCQS
jgi:hypothetical protein